MPRHRDGLTSASAFIYREDLLAPAGRPHPQILEQGPRGISAQVYHPVFSALAIMDQDLAAAQVQGCQLQPGHFLHPQAATGHEHDPVPVPAVMDNL